MAKLSYSQLKELWVQAGGNPRYADIAAAVALATSGGNTDYEASNNIGLKNIGLWGINSQYGSDASKDPLTNAKAAVALSNNGASWKTWSVAWHGLTYLGPESPALVHLEPLHGPMTKFSDLKPGDTIDIYVREGDTIASEFVTVTQPEIAEMGVGSIVVKLGSKTLTGLRKMGKNVLVWLGIGAAADTLIDVTNVFGDYTGILVRGAYLLSGLFGILIMLIGFVFIVLNTRAARYVGRTVLEQGIGGAAFGAAASVVDSGPFRRRGRDDGGTSGSPAPVPPSPFPPAPGGPTPTPKPRRIGWVRYDTKPSSGGPAHGPYRPRHSADAPTMPLPFLRRNP